MSTNHFCPHVEGSFVRRWFADGSSRVGRVVRRKAVLNGWILWVAFADGTVAPWPCDGSVHAEAAPQGVLLEGRADPSVVELQEALEQKGFPPGNKDGEFGVGTHNAVVAFQLSQGMAGTGVVDVATAEAVGLPRPNGLNSWGAFTVQVVAKMFSRHTPVANIKKHLPIVSAAMTSRGLASKSMALMALSTIRAESEGFEPIDEGVSQYNSSPNGHPFDLYDRRADLGNRGKPDGSAFKGRGFIQLTGRDNYARVGKLIGHPLEQQPHLANEPEIAASILAAFLKAREQRIEQALLMDDLRLARKLVNGGQHGLDRFMQAYRAGEALVV